MHQSRLVLLVAGLTALTVSRPLAAQAYDDDWMESCRQDSWRDREYDRTKHCEIREDSLRATGGTIRVVPGPNGGVAIRGWDADSIFIRARIQTYGRNEAAAAALARSIRIEASGSTIRAIGPDAIGRHENWSVTFEVSVPRHSDVALETENGPISVRDVTGKMDLTAQNGPVVLRGVGGDVRARVQNGPLTVVLTGTHWDGAGLDAESVNGPAELVLPDGYSARLETGTVNGPMSVDFPMTVTIQGRISHRISTTLGDGGPMVRVVTTNGPMSIRRR